jgi:hypothetical protein
VNDTGEPMRADDLDHKELLELNPEGGVIRFAEQRALLVDAVATGGGRKYAKAEATGWGSPL